jgi:hypothetical protein
MVCVVATQTSMDFKIWWKIKFRSVHEKSQIIYVKGLVLLLNNNLLILLYVSIVFYIMDDWLIDFLNGSLSGIGNCLSGYVFDTLKVRMQLDDTLSMTQAFKNIIKT